HAIDLVARALDLGAANLVARGFRGGFGFAGRLPRRLRHLGAVRKAVRHGRLRPDQRQRQSDSEHRTEQLSHVPLLMIIAPRAPPPWRRVVPSESRITHRAVNKKTSQNNSLEVE